MVLFVTSAKPVVVVVVTKLSHLTFFNQSINQSINQSVSQSVSLSINIRLIEIVWRNLDHTQYSLHSIKVILDLKYFFSNTTRFAILNLYDNNQTAQSTPLLHRIQCSYRNSFKLVHQVTPRLTFLAIFWENYRVLLKAVCEHKLVCKQVNLLAKRQKCTFAKSAEKRHSLQKNDVDGSCTRAGQKTYVDSRLITRPPTSVPIHCGA